MEQSKKRQNMIKAAKLYYFGNMSQDEIASMMEISRPKVSRLLAEARQLNIVQITIHDSSQSLDSMADTLREHFHLRHVSVVPSGNSEEAAKVNVGRAGSDFLNSLLRPGLRIGISWGTTLLAFSREFRARMPVPTAQVVQLLGGTYSKELDIDARDLVKTLADKLSCEASLLQAPLIVSNPALHELLMKEPAMVQHFRRMRELDVAFVGIGTAHSAKTSLIYQANYITPEEADSLRSDGYICDICSRLLLPDGSAPENCLANRVMGVTLENLRSIPLVVGLCTGNRKVPSVQAALRNGCINSLIIDEVAAIGLMAAEKLE